MRAQVYTCLLYTSLIAGTLTGIVVGVVAHVLVERLEGIVMRKSP